MKKAFLIFVILMLAIPALAKEAIFFTGIPSVKILEKGVSRQAENITKENVEKFKCVITKKDDQYYWTSKDNIQLIPISYGNFTTFIAVDATGYVRIANIEMTEDQPKAEAREPEEKFNYSEHQMIGLKSVTYYGKAK